MTVYLAGPITGVADYHQKFALAEYQLAEKGFTVLNPAVLPEGMEKADYMRICLAMVDTADIVVLLDGWEDSPGAKIESDYSKYIAKPMLTLHDFLQWEIETIETADVVGQPQSRAAARFSSD